jgi:hypothetical protein
MAYFDLLIVLSTNTPPKILNSIGHCGPVDFS